MTHEATLPETKGPHGWSREKGYYPLENAGDAQPSDEAQVAAPGAIASGATPAQLAELSDRYGANNVTENPDGSVTVSKTFSAAAVQEMFTHEDDEPPADREAESDAAGSGTGRYPEHTNWTEVSDGKDYPPTGTTSEEVAADRAAPGDPAAENQTNQQ